MGAGCLLRFRVAATRYPMASLIEKCSGVGRLPARRRMSCAVRPRLNERLARAEERLARLEITRETVAEILGGVGTDQPTAGRRRSRRLRRRRHPQAPWSPAGRRPGW